MKDEICPNTALNSLYSAVVPENLGLAYFGVRRSGKTIAAITNAQQASEKVLYINFEDPLSIG